MNCIFCHKDSSSSMSVEHIIPESLGNKDTLLPKGYVCDDCNHYFAIKVEKQILEQPYFVSLRSRNNILTKKNKLVKRPFFFPEIQDFSFISNEMEDNKNIICIDNDKVENAIINGEINSMTEPVYFEPEYPDQIMARFLAKCAIEYILYIIKDELRNIFIEDVIYQQMDPIRKFARYGTGTWAYSQRKVYDETALFVDSESKNPYQNLHEMTLFFRNYKKVDEHTSYAEIYFAIIIMGIEYVICLSDPDITGYTDHWLKDNDNKSPLERSNEHIVNGMWYLRNRYNK